MKTKIKIAPETLFLAHRIVRDASQCIARTREEKVRKSILEELLKLLPADALLTLITPMAESFRLL